MGIPVSQAATPTTIHRLSNRKPFIVHHDPQRFDRPLNHFRVYVSVDALIASAPEISSGRGWGGGRSAREEGALMFATLA